MEQTVGRLADHYRQAQLARVEDLVERHGEGPHLQATRRSLTAGELLTRSHVQALARQAREDHQARERQRDLRDAYLQRREREARRLAR